MKHTKRKDKIKRYVNYFIGISLFLIFWSILSYLMDNPVIPSLDKILKSFFNVFTDRKFINNLTSTLKIVAIGIGISIVVGIIIGMINDLYKNFKEIIEPIFESLRSVPAITLFPLILCLFGIGDISRIAIIVWTAIPPIILSTTHGLQEVDKLYVEAAKVFGANRMQIMLKVKFPIALPETLNGIKIGIGTGFISVVTAEMLGASSGIGYMILWSTNSFKYSDVYAYIIIVAILGLTFNGIMSIIINIIRRKVI